MIIRPLQHNWAQTAQTSAKDQPVCMVVITDVQGSAPRETGAIMVVFTDQIAGSIGGGELEYQAIEVARSNQPAAGFKRQVRSYPLGPSLGQCCGGTVKLMFEWYGQANQAELAELASQNHGYSLHDTTGQGVPTVSLSLPDHLPETTLALGLNAQVRDVFVYGAGHVGRAVIELARHLNCQLYWIDIHEDRYPETIAKGIIKLPGRTPQTIAARAPDGAIHLVISHSHQLDYEIVCAVLKSGNFAKCGLIGSQTKAARFRSRLRDSGFEPDKINQLVCPVGLTEVRGKAPFTVALSITAQLSNWLDDIPA